MSERTKRTIELTLTEPQAIALEDMLATWNQLGGMGSSRWTAFFADGDGDFQPQATIDGRKPETTTLVKREEVWQGDNYRIDFDTIAWRLRLRDLSESSR